MGGISASGAVGIAAALGIAGCGLVMNTDFDGYEVDRVDAAAGGAGGTSAGAGGTGLEAGPDAVGSDASTGGAGGSGGSGATGGGAGATGGCGSCGPLEECWNGQLCVAKLVAIPAPGGGTYGIDATEVTAAQYRAWIATGPLLGHLPSDCTSWKASWNDGSGTGRYPVATVDWCDAYGYCQGVGRRLCGKIGGGTSAVSDYADSTKSQWYNACSSGGVHQYPYGNPFAQSTCNYYLAGKGATVEVGSMSECESTVPGYAGVYDLSGNVWEWEDSCSNGSGAADSCHLRGGSFDASGHDSTCSFDRVGTSLLDTSGNIGFRCCSL